MAQPVFLKADYVTTIDKLAEREGIVLDIFYVEGTNAHAEPLVPIGPKKGDFSSVMWWIELTSVDPMEGFV